MSLPLPDLLRAYATLAKPRIVTMVLVTTVVGYVLGGGGFHPLHLMLTLAGVGLAVAGSGMLNNYLERETDRRMHRTAGRPLPSGRVGPTGVLTAGNVLVLGGVALLALYVNLLTAFLVLLAAFLYVLVYTPMKRLTWLNTSVGAIPGAIPPLSGWAAAAGTLDLGAWILFAVLFLWQHPHFYAIAWMYREDYARGGLKMLPVIDPTGCRTFAQVLGSSVVLLGVSLLPAWMGLCGWIYALGVAATGILMLLAGGALARSGSFDDARRLLRASLLYLPLWLGLILIDSALR